MIPIENGLFVSLQELAACDPKQLRDELVRTAREGGVVVLGVERTWAAVEEAERRAALERRAEP